MRGIFDILLNASAGDPNDERYWGGWGMGGHMSAAGRRVSPEIAMQVSTVYAAVNLLAKTVASLPLRMYRVDGKGNSFEEPNHPLNDLLEFQPNRWQTAWDFRVMLMTHLCLRGNGYAEIVSGPRGAVDRLDPIHPDRVTQIERLSDGSLRYTVRDAQGGVRKLLQDEIFHIRTAITDDGMRGKSPIEFALETIGLALAAEEHGARMFSNGARPSGIVTLQGTIEDDKKFERFKQRFNDAYSGNANHHRTAILENGAKFEAVTMTADELQFIATRQFEIEEIARWFDVPLVLLHHTEKTTSWGTGVEAIMLAFVRNNLMPWLTAWTQAIRRDLIIAPRLYEARFDTEALQRGDSKAMAEFFARLCLAGIITRNEARQALGYNPLSGLDEPLVPNNMMGGADNNRGNQAKLGHNGGPPLDDPAQPVNAAALLQLDKN